MPTKTKDHILHDTEIILSDGTTLRTRYDAILKKHLVSCDICSEVLKLPVTTNTQSLESHRRACKYQLAIQTDSSSIYTVPNGVLTPLFNLTPQPIFTAKKSKHTRITHDCPGQWVYWEPGSVWDSYPFHLHKISNDRWKPVAIYDKENGLVLRAKNCQKWIQEDEGACEACKRITRSPEFKAVVDRAQQVKDHTPWLYLTDLQKEDLMRRMAAKIRNQRTQVCCLVGKTFFI